VEQGKKNNNRGKRLPRLFGDGVVRLQNEMADEVKDKAMTRPGSSEAKFIFAMTVKS